MNTSGAVETFENARWDTAPQSREFRHTAAIMLVERGPVLDIGCGDGLLLSLLKEKGIEAQGVDLSPVAVQRCQTAGLTATVYDASQPLPFPDGTFECVVLLDVLEHVYDPGALLRDAARVSRNEVVVGVPNFSSLPSRIQVMKGVVPENNRPNKGHVYWFNENVLAVIAQEAGLQEADRRVNTFGAGKLLGGFLPRVWPNLFALSFVVKFEKQSTRTT
jgi:2-polyprenyl-3-methyl-5-hydroxy-6-metoxy-1,4-benzoquinol methylase